MSNMFAICLPKIHEGEYREYGFATSNATAMELIKTTHDDCFENNLIFKVSAPMVIVEVKVMCSHFDGDEWFLHTNVCVLQATKTSNGIIIDKIYDTNHHTVVEGKPDMINVVSTIKNDYIKKYFPEQNSHVG